MATPYKHPPTLVVKVIPEGERKKTEKSGKEKERKKEKGKENAAEAEWKEMQQEYSKMSILCILFRTFSAVCGRFFQSNIFPE